MESGSWLVDVESGLGGVGKMSMSLAHRMENISEA
jgi:hypothetical protein